MFISCILRMWRRRLGCPVYTVFGVLNWDELSNYFSVSPKFSPRFAPSRARGAACSQLARMTSWRLRLLLACLTCLSLSSGSSLTSAAAHGGPSCRPAVLTHGLRLRGGQEAQQPLTLRLNSRDGIKRIKTPGGHITLSMLQQLIRTQLHIPPSKQHVSLQAGGELLDMSGEQTLAELGLKQGSMLHLASNIGVDTVSADKAARRASSTSRRVSMDVTADKTLLKVALVPAPAAPCQFVSIDARAWQNFAAYLIDS